MGDTMSAFLKNTDQLLTSRPITVLYLTEADMKEMAELRERFPILADAGGMRTADDLRPRHRGVPFELSTLAISYGSVIEHVGGQVKRKRHPLDGGTAIEF